MKSKVSKILKIICVVIAVVILFVVLGGIIFYNAFLKDRAENMIEIIDNVIYDETFMGDLISDELISEIDQYIETEIPNENDNMEIKDVIGSDGSIETIINDAKNNFVSGQNPAANNTQSTDIIDNPEQTKPKEDYKSKYEYIKENVSPADFSKALGFASRIDIQYILGLLSGGLDAEEKSELKRYLKKNFSQSEISQGISLYSKYIHLLK